MTMDETLAVPKTGIGTSTKSNLTFSLISYSSVDWVSKDYNNAPVALNNIPPTQSECLILLSSVK